jgi:hypothetical protein
MNLARKVIIALFILVTLAPLVAVVCSPRFLIVASEVIKDPSQRLAQADALRRATPLWDQAVKLYSTALYRLGVSASPGQAVVGRNGWVFLGDIQAKSFSQMIHRRVLSDQETTNWTATLRRQTQWLQRQGIPLIFIVAPSSGTIYSENLPSWTLTERRSRPSSFDRVLAAGPDLPLIDVRPELKAAKVVAPTYSPFNSHWTDFGAWVAWQKAATRLKAVLPNFQPVAADGKGNIVRLGKAANEYEELAGIVARNPWTVFEPSPPLPDFEIVAPDGSTRRVPGMTKTNLLELPRQTLNVQAPNDLTAMVLSDSMGTSMSPFVQASFRQTIQLNHHFTQYPWDRINLIEAVRKHKPNVVVYIMTERYFDVPLGDPYYWYSVEAFDGMPSDLVAIWKRDDPQKSNIVTNGDPTLTLGNEVRLIWPAGIANARERAIRITVKARGVGTAKLRCFSEGRTDDFYEEYLPGANELYFRIPGIFNDSCTLALYGAYSAALDLQSVVQRGTPL